MAHSRSSFKTRQPRPFKSGGRDRLSPVDDEQSAWKVDPGNEGDLPDWLGPIYPLNTQLQSWSINGIIIEACGPFNRILLQQFVSQLWKAR